MHHTPQAKKHLNLIFGTRAIIETIRAGKAVDKVFIDKATQAALNKELLSLLNQQQIPYSQVPAAKLDKLTRKNHQGAIALLSPIDFVPLSHVVQVSYEQGKMPLLLLLDGITDMKNFGAIVRTAACTGVDAIIIPTQGSASLGGDAMKTSAGALSHVPICRVKHLKEAIQYLQASGLQIFACHEKAVETLYKVDLNFPLAIILGAESQGIANEHLRLADKHVQIPMWGAIASLNVSVAAAVILYESMRQRHF